MDISKYYRRRKSNEFIDTKLLLELNLPMNYIGFAVKYNTMDIAGLCTDIPITIAVEHDQRLLGVEFVNPNHLGKYYVDYGDTFYEENIVKIADNNIPERGFFINLDNCAIYNFSIEPLSIEKGERVPLYKSFEDFFNAISLYKRTENSFEKWDLEVPDNKDELLYPWESNSLKEMNKSGFDLILRSTIYSKQVISDFEKILGVLPLEYQEFISNYKSGYPSLDVEDEVEVFASSKYRDEEFLIESFLTLPEILDRLTHYDRVYSLVSNHRKFRLIPICNSGSSYREYFLKIDTGEIFFLDPNQDVQDEMELNFLKGNFKLADNFNEFVESFFIKK